MDTRLYPGIPFSPQAELTDGISAADTVIPVSDVSAFPPAPNLATIGEEVDGETILYTAKTDTSLSGCRRGVEGAAKSWPAGELIGRNWTAKDHNDLIAAVSEAQDAAGGAQGSAEAAEDAAAAAALALSAHKSDPSAHEERFAALEAKYRRHVIAVRERDPSKPEYGLEGGGAAVVALEVGAYTGGAAVTAIVSGVEYDAKNMSVNGEDLPDGTLILTKMED